MATVSIHEAPEFVGVVQALAQVEDVLRDYAKDYPADSEAGAAVHSILFTEFGVTLPR